MFRHYAPGHPQGCIKGNAGEIRRLGPMLRQYGGIAISDDPGDIELGIELFGTPDAYRAEFEAESRSVFGKPRVRKLHLAILPPQGRD